MEGLSLHQDVWASAGRRNSWGLESSEDSCTSTCGGYVGWQLGAWAPFCVHYSVGELGVLHSMVAGFHRASILKREN